VRKQLDALRPSNALLAIPSFPWRALFTTNYDQLIEKSYTTEHVDLAVIRSNFDFSTLDFPDVPRLYKLHGCISQDVAYGHHGRMLLTERDYDELEPYREALLQALTFTMMTADTLVIGQSLRDTHLRDLAKQVADLHSRRGTPGQIFLLAYQEDPDRALLFEQRGIQVAFGDLERFFHALAGSSPPVARPAYTSETDKLSVRLTTATVDVAHAAALPPNAVSLFNGTAATYGDIAAGLTIPRAVERRLLETQTSRNALFLVLTGVAGVGKTSLARRILFHRMTEGALCWEHSPSFPLDNEAWIAAEETLRASGKQAILLVDDCVQQLTALNKLVDGLGRLTSPALRIVATANLHSWQSRTKSPFFFSRGHTETLSRLMDADLEQLVNLVDREPAIRSLVEQEFALLTRQQRIKRLRDRCSAEMYVCLKNIFASEELDQILLREYAELSAEEQDVYRHVAVLQAMGGKVHRQLILRLLNVAVNRLQAMLAVLEGIVGEYDINRREGLYGWATRHDVIADVIATYKFAAQDELLLLLDRVIDGLNPTVWLELETARAICTTEWGIARLNDSDEQIRLLRKLISVVPGERIPRRRLVRRYLDAGRLDDASRAIKIATEAIGRDSVLERYKVSVALRRAEQTVGILSEDRIAMLYQAQALAVNCAQDNPTDRHSYRILAEVGVALARRTGDPSSLDDAISAMRDAEQRLLDPELMRDRRRYEQIRRSLGAGTQEGGDVVADIVMSPSVDPGGGPESDMDEPA
jgi:SIR2-like domain